MLFIHVGKSTRNKCTFWVAEGSTSSTQYTLIKHSSQTIVLYIKKHKDFTDDHSSTLLCLTHLLDLKSINYIMVNTGLNLVSLMNNKLTRWKTWITTPAFASHRPSAEPNLFILDLGADLLSSLPVNIFIVTTIRGQEAFSATFHAKQQENTGGSGTKHGDLYSGWIISSHVSVRLNPWQLKDVRLPATQPLQHFSCLKLHSKKTKILLSSKNWWLLVWWLNITLISWCLRHWCYFSFLQCWSLCVDVQHLESDLWNMQQPET